MKPRLNNRTWKTMTALAAIALLAIGIPPAAADAGTPCLSKTAPIVGDGPLVGDAPDGADVPLAWGCYNGSVGATDIDSFVLLPRARQLMVESIGGCFSVTLELLVSGTVVSPTLCDGESFRVGILGPMGTFGQPLRLSFAGGEGTYWFAFE